MQTSLLPLPPVVAGIVFHNSIDGIDFRLINPIRLWEITGGNRAPCRGRRTARTTITTFYSFNIANRCVVFEDCLRRISTHIIEDRLFNLVKLSVDCHYRGSGLLDCCVRVFQSVTGQGADYA